MKKLRLSERWRAQFGHLSFFPLKNVVSKYSLKDAFSDLKASINVALLTFPMGMAFALMAGLPIQTGIVGSAVAAIVGPIFSGTSFLAFGPSNATAVMLLSALTTAGAASVSERLAVLPTIVVLVGIFLILASVTKVANFVQYISRTVVAGYITAAAILIMANQLPNLLGISPFPNKGTFYELVSGTIFRWSEINPSAVILASGTIGVYAFVKKFLPKFPDMALALIAACFLAVPVNSLSVSMLGNDAISLSTLENFGNETLSFTFPNFSFNTLSTSFSAALAIAILAMIEGSSIGKSIAARSGSRFDSNQELFGLGMANLACGISGGMQASGSLTRSALASSSGASTAFSGIFSGIILAAALFGSGNLMHFIPKSALAALVIFAGTRLINMKTIRLVTSATRGDRAVFFLTLTCGLIAPLDIAIYFGVGLSILLFLRKTSTPEIVEYVYNEAGELAEKVGESGSRDPEVSIVHIDGNLYFGSAEIFQEHLRRMLADPDLRVLILKFRNAHHLDATSAMLLEELVRSAKSAGRSIIICEVREEVFRVFKAANLVPVIGEENIFMDSPENLPLSSAKAIRHAYEILGGREARVSIFVAPKNAEKK